MWRAEVVVSFIGDGTEDNANRPNIGDDYALKKWEDVTGTPSVQICPDPNMYVVRIECEEAVLDTIESDANYFICWSEEIAEEGF